MNPSVDTGAERNPLSEGPREQRRRRALFQEVVVRALVALLVFAFNEIEGLGLGGYTNPVTRVVALLGLAFNLPYVLAARTGWRERLQAHMRMLVDVGLVTAGMYGVGGLAAAQYIGVYAVIPVYVGIALSSRACIMASAAATVSYLVVAMFARGAGVPTAVLLPHAWRIVAFNLLVLNVVGVLTAFLSHAYRQSRRRTRESEERFSAVAESAIDAIISADARGTILSWNKSARAMFGYTREEIIGQPLTRLMPERYRASYEQELARYAATEQPRVIGRTVELEGLGNDGNEFPVDLALSSWRTEEGLFFSAIIRDITERKRGERALRESEERFRGLFEQAAIGVYRTTPDGRILLANPTLVRMLGYERVEELAARNLEEGGFGADSPRSRFKAIIEREGQVTGLEATWYRRDGSLIFVRESSKVIRDEGGRVRYYEGTVEDITERRSLEGQLRQSQKMDAIGRLAGGVAHDFNNLLTAILGYGALIARALPEGNPARERADEIVKAATRAATLTRQLLTLSRGQVLEPTTLNLNAVVADMEKMLRRLIVEDIEIATRFDPALSLVKTDEGQMEQVVLNLAINARDAMPRGGRITIETANVQLDDAYARAHVGITPGPYVMLAVSDTGCGMDAEIQSHIFEPFFTTKEPGRGTGLGLATVYGIVKQSGGAIGVYSEVGSGSTFRIYLPQAAGGVERSEPTAPSRELPRGSERILLVEDDAMVRGFTASLLRESGYTVLEAANPSDALSLLADGAPIALVVTDIVMPRMSGPDLARRLFESRPDMKVLFVSGYAGSHVTDGAVLPPGSAFLPKPFTPQALTRKVREVLDGLDRHGARASVRPARPLRPEAPSR